MNSMIDESETACDAMIPCDKSRKPGNKGSGVTAVSIDRDTLVELNMTRAALDGIPDRKMDRSTINIGYPLDFDSSQFLSFCRFCVTQRLWPLAFMVLER
ncbi:MAG: hypothetical protein ACKVT0_09255 [Planctomycetaceae bacterium]